MFYLLSHYFNVLISNVVEYLLHHPEFVVFATLNLLGIFLCLVAYVVYCTK
jgi:hypothetical protein